MFMYYTVCYFTGIFYAVVRQISMLFIDNKDSVFCKLFKDGTTRTRPNNKPWCNPSYLRMVQQKQGQINHGVFQVIQGWHNNNRAR